MKLFFCLNTFNILQPKSKASVRVNIIVNYFGRFWAAFLNLALVPLYIRFLGIEAYGLLGFYATLQGILVVMDLGLSTVINRQLARLSAHEGTIEEQRNLVRTLEIIYWGIGILLGLIIFWAAPWIATKWIKPGTIPAATITQSIILMGIIIAFQWPSSFYSGGLMGLQSQVGLNVIKCVMATLQGGGAVLLLWLVAPSIIIFFSWQIITGLATTLLMALFLWKLMPLPGHHAGFHVYLLRTFWSFAAGVTGISMMAVILGQLDKVLLSRILSLANFGYYALASTVGMAVLWVITPISAAVFPRLTQLITAGKEDDIVVFYHKACQLVAVVLVPISLLLILFSKEILAIWLRDPVIVEHVYMLLSLVTVGSLINGIITLPYFLQISHGWTSLTMYASVFAVSFMVGTISFAVNTYGAIAAPVILVIINAGMLLVCIPIMHRRLLRFEMRRWYILDVFLPILVVLIPMSLGRWLYFSNWPPWISLIYMGALWTISTAAVVLIEPETRKYAKRITLRLIKPLV